MSEVAKAGTMDSAGLDYVGAYEHSFGRLPTKTPYANTAFGDMREELGERYEIGLKALTSTAGGAGTAGYALVPIYVDPRITDQSRKFTPWTEVLQRVTNYGLTADFNIITAKGAAYAAVEDASLSDTTDTEDRSSVAIKYLYSVGRVTGQIQAAMPPYILYGFQPQGSGLAGSDFTASNVPNAMQYEIMKKSRALKELEETLLWNGNATTSSQSQNANGTEFNGIIATQSTTNKNDLNSTALAWDDVDATAKLAFDDSGRPSVGGCGSAVYNDLRAVLFDQFRLRPSDMAGGKTPAGIASRLTLETSVGPIEMIPSQFLTNTSGSKELWFLDPDVIEMRVLQDQTYIRLAQTNDSEKFFIKEYLTLINRAAAFSAFTGEIL